MAVLLRAFHCEHQNPSQDVERRSQLDMPSPSCGVGVLVGFEQPSGKRDETS